MRSIALVVIVFLSTAALLLIWRVSSRRHTLPCPAWLRWMVELDNPFAESNRADFIVRHLELEPGMSILDAGCGPGRVTIPLARAVAPNGIVVAADLQDRMLEAVSSKANTLRLHNIEILRISLGRGDLPERRFDRAVMVAVLGEIPDRAAAVTELFRAIRPGGLLAIAELVFDPHFQQRSVVTDLALRAGFTESAFFGNRAAYLLLLKRP